MLICTDKKRPHSCVSFNVNSSNLLLLPFLGHILLPCRCVSTETIHVSDMTVNLRTQSDSSEIKYTTLMGFWTKKCVCACIHCSLPYTICAFISTPITQLYVHYFERFPECVSNHIKRIGGAQQTKSHWNTITGKKLSSSYPSHCVLSVLSALVSPQLGIIQQEILL